MKQANIRSPLLLLLASVAFFFLCDNLIFRSGLYSNLIGGNTLAGTLHYQMIREQARSKSKIPSVLAIGNSQFQWGLDFKALDQAHFNPPFNIYRLDTAATGPEVWYFTLRHVDPNHDKYNVILIPLDDYKQDGFLKNDQHNERIIRFLSPFITSDEWMELIAATPDNATKLNNVQSALFLSSNFEMDLQNLILHLPYRLKSRDDTLRNLDSWRRYTDDIALGVWKNVKLEKDGTMSNCPIGFEPHECQVESSFLSTRYSEKQANENALYNRKYNQYWLGNIINMYLNSPTKIVFVRMPTYLKPYKTYKQVLSAGDIRDLVPRAKNIIFMDENTFSELETPDYMHDIWHLGKPGREIFTKKMGNYLESLIANTSKEK